MKSFLLVYSDPCPNYKSAIQMLEEIGLAFAEINQNDMHEGCWGKNLSSPTLLARVGDDDIIIFGGETNSEQGACTRTLPDSSLPDKEELRTLINGLA